MAKKIWKLKPKIPEDVAEELSEFHPLIRQLLYNRKYLNKKSAKEFLESNYKEGLSSPLLFKDMQKAAARIWQAFENEEKIFIYGDYDADAVTANAVLRLTFRYLDFEAESYIPDRFTEGYGVNLEALEKLRAQGAKLIITVDCGTNSVEAAKWCKKNNIDFIITDHHEIIGELPEAFALINPKNPYDNYPYSELTGVGVAFKLAQAVLLDQDKVEFQKKKAAPTLRPGQPAAAAAGWEKWLLDLVAIGTVADCHSLTGENRILVKYGLLVLIKSRWIGLKSLCQKAGLNFTKKLPDAYTLGFILGPRLNAAGRLEHANIALNLLLETDSALAAKQADTLEQLNAKRQDITARIFSEAREKAVLLDNKKIIVLLGENWPKGIVGLVAGKISEEFYRPTIVLEKGEEESTGSARSIGEFNIVKALSNAAEHLVRFGGHKQAAGLTLKNENFEKFYEQILNYANEFLKDEDLERVLELEAELGESTLSMEVYRQILGLEPFGFGNPKPKFFLKNIRLESLKAVGNAKQHLQMRLQIGEKNISAIFFSGSNFAKNLAIGDTLEVAAELMEDGWNGKKDIKLKIIDINK